MTKRMRRKRRRNNHNCNGDENCIARQSLVLAVDGSGLIKADGLELVTNCTALVRWDQGWKLGESDAIRFSLGQNWCSGKRHVELFKFDCDVLLWQENPEDPKCDWTKP